MDDGLEKYYYWPFITGNEPERWNVIREKGRWRFIISRGCLGLVLGMIVGVAVDLFYDLLIGDPYNPVYAGVIIFSLSGICSGYFMWRDNEKLFQKHKASRQFP